MKYDNNNFSEFSNIRNFPNTTLLGFKKRNINFAISWYYFRFIYTEWLLHQEEMIGISFEDDFIERFKKVMEL